MINFLFFKGKLKIILNTITLSFTFNPRRIPRPGQAPGVTRCVSGTMDSGAGGGLPTDQVEFGLHSPHSLTNGINGAGMVNLDNNNQDAKRLKMEQNGVKITPSKVIHIRNIPNDVTEAEIIHLGIPFGRVTNVLVLKGKNQAFLEMEEEPSAVAMVNYFTNCVAQLRERSVYVQFSNHTALKTDQVSPD